MSQSIDSSANILSVASSSGLSEKSRITINDELIYINSINGNDLTVIRGYENTTPVSHIASTAVFVVDSEDDDLIEDLGMTLDLME